MPIPDNFADIIAKLVAKSKTGKVHWRESSSAGTFFVPFPTFSFELWRYDDPDDGSSGLAAGIRDSKGEIVDAFAVGDGDKGHRQMEELYELARRKARNVDQVLKTITSALDSDGDIGTPY